MVYDRRFEDRLLRFEASGALKNAALVMRDRETDSWWSMMSGDAIGGELRGTRLVELPVGEKTSWREWRQRHPDTLVLSVDGEEHVDNNPYDNYFTSDRTFRDLEITDQRLAPKEPVFSFWIDGRPWAIAHRAFAGGGVFAIEGLEGKRLLLYRDAAAAMYQSSVAYLVDDAVATAQSPEQLLAMVSTGEIRIEALPGFDTFWYTWVSANPKTELIR